MLPISSSIITITLYSLFFGLLFLKGFPMNWQAKSSATAFIAALYAEMWGFPLSLLVLTSFFGADHLPYQFDNLVYYFTQVRIPTDQAFVNPPLVFRIEYNLARGFTLLGILPIMNGWCELMNAKRRGELIAVGGPYEIVRHPQYIGFMLFIVGMILYWPTLLTIPMGIILCYAYYRLAMKEESGLRENLAYRLYSKAVPAFLSRQIWHIFQLPRNSSSKQKTISFALVFPFALWFLEGFVAWGLGFESQVRQYWFPVAYSLPVHIGLVASVILVASIHVGDELKTRLHQTETCW